MKYGFDIIEKKIIVKPQLKGVDRAREFKFLLDTGASQSIIDEQVAIQLGFDLKKLEQGNRLMTAGGGISSKKLKLPKITFFGKDFSNFNVNVVKFPLQMLFVIEGIIGMDFLLRFKNLKLDFVQKTAETDSD